MGFNLIIAADVSSKYFLKHLLTDKKLSEQSFFFSNANFTLSCTVFLRWTLLRWWLSALLNGTSKEIGQYQINFLHYTRRIRRMSNITAAMCLLYISSHFTFGWPQFSGWGHFGLTLGYHKLKVMFTLLFSGLKSKLKSFCPQMFLFWLQKWWSHCQKEEQLQSKCLCCLSLEKTKQKKRRKEESLS